MRSDPSSEYANNRCDIFAVLIIFDNVDLSEVTIEDVSFAVEDLEKEVDEYDDDDILEADVDSSQPFRALMSADEDGEGTVRRLRGLFCMRWRAVRI